MNSHCSGSSAERFLDELVFRVTECDAAGATIATVTDTASSIGNAHQAIAAYLGLLPWPTAEVQVAA